ncbi:MAG: hypothetical protein IIY21_09500 [Clostridiales bacterium]|nr:hypothetical protein [Clostridiales bacterium]
MEKITALFLILFSISHVALVIAILYGANIIKEWGNAIVDRIEVLTDKIEKLDTKKEDEIGQTIRNQILANLRERWARPQITVQDDDKPLDFPNDHK